MLLRYHPHTACLSLSSILFLLDQPSLLDLQEPDCPHFLKKGWCAFGATCKYHHDDAAVGPSPVGAGGRLMQAGGSTTSMGLIMIMHGSHVMQVSMSKYPESTLFLMTWDLRWRNLVNGYDQGYCFPFPTPHTVSSPCTPHFLVPPHHSHFTVHP